MPYIQRSATGKIVALSAEAAYSGQEYLPGEHLEIVAFLHESEESSGSVFTALDADFIRVMEDLIDTLIGKGLLRLTDLPLEAQTKLLSRKGLRKHLLEPLDLMDKNNDII